MYNMYGLDYGHPFVPGIPAFGQVAGFATMLLILYVVILVSIAAFLYYISCVPQERIATKLGSTKKWMAYVPFARNIQRMRMTGMAMWKLLFVGTFFTSIIATFILSVVTVSVCTYIDLEFGLYFSAILSFSYMVLSVIFTYEYYTKLTTKFGYDHIMGVMMFVPVVNTIFTYAMAFSSRVQPEGKASVKKEAIPEPQVTGEVGIEGVYGTYAGAKFEMKPTDVFVIGRDSTLSNIIINYEKVSKRHCSIEYIAAEGCYKVVDFSTNGTFNGNSKLDANIPSKLSRGAIIAIGDKENQFRLL